jgi:nicotinamidase-related amidase
MSHHTTALLLIDPQRAFTRGCWMRYFGASEVVHIKEAFLRASKLVRSHSFQLVDPPMIVTRCPFPPEDVEFDDCFEGSLDSLQCLLKPGNSVFLDPKFKEWLEDQLRQGVRTLVVGGCTTNSCVRVSAIDMKKVFGDRVEVIVDLNLCGARVESKGRVQEACHEMMQVGVQIVHGYDWDEYDRKRREDARI